MSISSGRISEFSEDCITILSEIDEEEAKDQLNDTNKQSDLEKSEIVGEMSEYLQILCLVILSVMI